MRLNYIENVELDDKGKAILPVVYVILILTVLLIRIS